MDRRLVLLSHRYRFAWVQVPKVASTTLKSMLERAHGVDAADDGHRPTRNSRLAGSGLEYRVVGPRGLERMAKRHPDYYFFCFVRDPYARLASGYRNKLSRFARRYHPLAYLKSKAEQLAGRETRLFDRLSERVPFERFVLDLRRFGHDFDDHFRGQFKIVRAEDTPYAKVGRIENFDDDVAEIAGAVGMDLPDTPGGGGQRLNATSSGGPVHDRQPAEGYSSVARDAVYQMYRRDFEAFRYAA